MKLKRHRMMPLCIQKLVRVKSGPSQSGIETTVLSLGFFIAHWKSSIWMMQVYTTALCVYRRGSIKTLVWVSFCLICHNVTKTQNKSLFHQSLQNAGDRGGI